MLREDEMAGGVGALLSKSLLDWSLLGGAAVTRPTEWWISLASAAPTATSPNELGISRRSVQFGESTNGSAGNVNAITFGGFTAQSLLVAGINVMDGSTAGNQLFYGVSEGVRTVNVGEQLVLAAGALIVSIE